MLGIAILGGDVKYHAGIFAEINIIAAGGYRPIGVGLVERAEFLDKAGRT